jgi:hypothetical protein
METFQSCFNDGLCTMLTKDIMFIFNCHICNSERLHLFMYILGVIDISLTIFNSKDR